MPYYPPASQSSSSNIEEVSVDPSSPIAGQVWILRMSLLGTPIGLLLALTYANNVYQLSYRTEASTTIRTVLF